MDVTELVPVDSRELANSMREFCASITEVVVEDEDQYKAACEQAKRLHALRKELKSAKTDAKADPLARCKAIDAWYKEHDGPAENAMRKLDAGTAAYEERKKREDDERQRRENEKAERERERAQKRAEKHLANGNYARAAEAEVKAQTVVAPIVPNSIAPPKGQSRTIKYVAEITDEADAIRGAVQAAFIEWLVGSGVEAHHDFIQAVRTWIGGARFPTLQINDKALNLEAARIGEPKQMRGWRVVKKVVTRHR